MCTYTCILKFSIRANTCIRAICTYLVRPGHVARIANIRWPVLQTCDTPVK